MYDLRRTLTGRYTIIVTVIIILASAGIGYALTAAGSSGTAPSIHTDSSYTYSNGTYNVTIFAFNQNGQPASNLDIYTQYNNTYANLTTDSNGFAQYTIKDNATELMFNYSLSPITGSAAGAIYHKFLVGQYFSGDSVQVFLTQIIKPGTTNSHELLMYYSPTYLNQTSNKVYIYYGKLNLTGNIQFPTMQNMTFYQELTVSKVGTQLIEVNIPNLTATQGVAVTVFNGNNTTAFPVASASYIPQNIISQIGVASLAFTVFAALFGLFIPLLAGLSAYFYFGKDRASGVLESVITRPVTKGRIILSRYIANVGSMVIAFAIGTAVFDLFLYRATGANLSLEYAGSLIWTYFVEIAAFTGFTYLASQFLKSQGAILGVAVSLFLVFSIVWSFIISPLLLTFVFHAVAGTNTYQQLTVYFDMINPAGYSSLMLFLISPVSSIGGGSIDAAKFGVTQISVAIIGLLWILVPIILAFVIGRKRD